MHPMVHQTDTDVRVQTAELALIKLKAQIFTRTPLKPVMFKEETNKVLSLIESPLMTMKFSYMEPGELASSEMVKQIFENSKRLYMGHKNSLDDNRFPPLPRATILWSFNVLSGLSRRLKNSGEKTTHGIDLVIVQIRNIVKNGELFTTKCTAGHSEFTIVTNIPGLKAGDTLRAALLPPSLVGGVVSEAMFLGSELVNDEPGTIIKPEDVETKEADSILYNELRKL